MTNFLKLLFLQFVLMLSIATSFAQNQTNYWYFGNKAGLNFNFSPPRIWNNSQMVSFGGSTTVSNAKGALLFYARGKTIWDNKHWIIAKDIRSKYGSQGQQALPIPGNSSLHYFFHTAPMGSFIPKPGESNHNNGLFYTIINTAAKVRSKKIVKKNIHIKAGVIPTISTMLHANQRDYWLVVRDTINTFYAYLVTTQGIANKPVVLLEI